MKCKSRRMTISLRKFNLYAKLTYKLRLSQSFQTIINRQLLRFRWVCGMKMEVGLLFPLPRKNQEPINSKTHVMIQKGAVPCFVKLMLKRKENDKTFPKHQPQQETLLPKESCHIYQRKSLGAFGWSLNLAKNPNDMDLWTLMIWTLNDMETS